MFGLGEIKSRIDKVEKQIQENDNEMTVVDVAMLDIKINMRSIQKAIEDLSSEIDKLKLSSHGHVTSDLSKTRPTVQAEFKVVTPANLGGNNVNTENGTKVSQETVCNKS